MLGLSRRYRQQCGLKVFLCPIARCGCHCRVSLCNVRRTKSSLLLLMMTACTLLLAKMAVVSGTLTSMCATPLIPRDGDRHFEVVDGGTIQQEKKIQDDGALSSKRGFMGAAMLSSPTPAIVFAGGISSAGGAFLEGNVDVFLQPDDSLQEKWEASEQGLEMERRVLRLRIPRTGIATGATTRSVFLAGGCGVDEDELPPRTEKVDENTQEVPAAGVEQRDGDGDEDPAVGAVSTTVTTGGEGSSSPNDPQLVKNCRATDAVDVFVAAGHDRDGGGEGVGVVTIADDTIRLCEAKYAAAVGVFYTGTPDDGSPSSWSSTAHVMVAGGVVPTGDGENYAATDTIDILREDAVDPATGKAKITKLDVQRLPNPPRSDMTVCCFKHLCVLAGGRVSIGSVESAFNTDRAEVWDGSTLSFETWGERTLTEARHLMGAAVIEVTLGTEKRVLGFFAGGISNGWNSSMVDMFDFEERRMLPPINAPSVSGSTQGVSLTSEVAAFISVEGKIDVFDGRNLCWTSYEIDGFLRGMSVVGRSPAWFFNASSPGFHESGSGAGSDGVSVQEALAFVGGGAEDENASGNVLELRWRKMEDPGDPELEACLGGQPLRQLQRMCGSPGPDGSIEFCTRCEEERRSRVHAIGAAGSTGGTAASSRKAMPNKRVYLYIMAALSGILVSYLASAAIILRKEEGVWRLPCGCGWYWCCPGSSESRSPITSASSRRETFASEGTRLLPPGAIETVRPSGALFARDGSRRLSTKPHADRGRRFGDGVINGSTAHHHHCHLGQYDLGALERKGVHFFEDDAFASADGRDARAIETVSQKRRSRKENANHVSILSSSKRAAESALRLAEELASGGGEEGTGDEESNMMEEKMELENSSED